MASLYVDLEGAFLMIKLVDSGEKQSSLHNVGGLPLPHRLPWVSTRWPLGWNCTVCSHWSQVCPPTLQRVGFPGSTAV